MKGDLKRQKNAQIKAKETTALVEYCDENDIEKEILTDSQVRLTHYCEIRRKYVVIDVYPLSKRYHNITTQERGTFTDLIGSLMITFI